MGLLFRHSQVCIPGDLKEDYFQIYVSVKGHLNSKQLPLEASFSPDSQFVISGSSDGRIHIWNSAVDRPIDRGLMAIRDGF